MFTYNDLKEGVRIILNGQPYEVLEANSLKKAQRRVTVQTKIRNLITGNLLEKNFYQGDTFEGAEIIKIKARFLYSHRGRYFFCKEDNSAERFELTLEQIGEQAKFLKSTQPIEALIFESETINVILPIKIHLRVAESPPGVRGDRAQGGNKTVVLETGATAAVPLFIKEGDIIEINTETGGYVRRVE